MRIVIDLQAAQSPGSRHRGIGRYSIALAKAMLSNRQDHEILLALNGMFEDTLAPLRETFAGLLPDEDIHVWHATIPAMPVGHGSPAQRLAAEAVREAFLASLQPDVVHVSSLFESSSYSITSVHALPGAPITAVTLYDLIPYIYPDIYLDTPHAREHYLEKIAHLQRADLLLAISESSRQEGMEQLGLPGERVVNISSDADAHFTAAPVPPERESALRAQLGLAQPFALYTGGIDHRKNIEGLVQAWAALPPQVRASHQLAVVCSVRDHDRARIERVARNCGLSAGEVVLTGFVSDADLVDLYRLCKVFVFPSRHEGFGLPALEAMRCGAAVIGADNSSIPEVIGRADALFDARSVPSITAKLLACLTDDAFRASLVEHGTAQARKFDWDRSARVALAAFEEAVAQRQLAAPSGPPQHRPRLAFVSPLPPQRSGIAGYSAELLPALARHYEIELIVDAPEPELPASLAALPRRTPEWLLAHSDSYDRVLYHVGNSSFHDYMFPLLERVPGTVVLHDFYLGGVMAHREFDLGERPWCNALYASHGWPALGARFNASEVAGVAFKYPANFEVIRDATRVIVHSEHAARLARDWYGDEATAEWSVIPLLREPAPGGQREAARQRLGIEPGEFVVCSFGQLGPTKLNDRLLRAWRASALDAAPECRLVFVGEQQQNREAEDFTLEVGEAANVFITGWTDNAAYRDFLDAADLGVQLRTLSRGETSAAVLDCMNHGLATIANREGSMADLDPEAVWLLPQAFSDAELAEALETLWRDGATRRARGALARRIVHTQHQPEACAAAYVEAIEASARSAARGVGQLVRHLGNVIDPDPQDPLLPALASAIAQNMPVRRPAAQLLVDVTAWAGDATRRELPPALAQMFARPVHGWRVEPVRRAADGCWRYARRATLAALGCPDDLLADDPVEVQRGDLWSALSAGAGAQATALARGDDPAGGALRPAAATWATLAALQARPDQRRWFIDISELVQRDWQAGIQRVVKNYLTELLAHPPADTAVVPVYATVDEPGYRVASDYLCQLAGMEPLPGRNLPVTPQRGDLFFGLDLQPQVIPAQEAWLASLQHQGVRRAFMLYDLLPIQLPDCFAPGAAENHARWLEVVAQADLVVAISQAVADEFNGWLDQHPTLSRAQRPEVRAVHLGGDLEHSLPSRGLSEGADELLQQMRQGTSFLMVGTLEPRKGHAPVLAAFDHLWSQGLAVNLVIAGRPGWMVEPLIERLRSHPLRGLRLFWFEDASDELLQRLYAQCQCLVYASRGEGFGLPLIEAAQHGLPIVSRDLPVFREIAGEHAFYFQDDTPAALAGALQQWLNLHRRGAHPRSAGMKWLSWRDSAAQLKSVLLAG